MESAIVCCKLPKCRCKHLKYKAVGAILVARTKRGEISFFSVAQKFGSWEVALKRLWNRIEVEQFFSFLKTRFQH